jgi:dCMP deaminase
MRKPWDEYFMDIAIMVATRATCDRAHVGAVIVKDKRILATGYNGSPPGQPHCDDVGHLMVNEKCVRTIHAEQNALMQCVQHGISAADADIYVTHYPCLICTKLLLGAGIRRIFVKEAYRIDENAKAMLEASGVEVCHMP